jgi:capsular polysaccharide biosynthesis protein
MSENQPAGVPATNFLSVLWRHKLLILICTLLGAGLGLASGMLQPSTYLAESRVFLSSQSGFDALAGQQDSANPSRYLDQQAALLTSTPLLTRSLALGADASDVQELRDSLDVVASAESDVLTVRGTATGPDAAASRVDATIASYREYQKAQVADQLKAVDSLSNADEKRLANQRAVIFGDGVELVEQASVTATGTVLRNATVLGVVGALIGSAIAFVSSARRGRRAGRTSVGSTASDDDPRVPAGWSLPTPQPTLEGDRLPAGSRTP